MRETFQNAYLREKVFFANSSTPLTGVTSLTFTGSGDIQLSKNDETTAADITSALVVTEIGAGLYQVVSSLTSHLDTLGVSGLFFPAQGNAIEQWVLFQNKEYSEGDIYDLVGTRLAAVAAVGIHPDVLETIIDGTLISGSITDVDDNNQTYVVVQETGDDSGGGSNPGEFQIPFTHNSLTQSYDKAHFLGRYEGNAPHIVTLQIQNQNTSVWYDITGAEASSRIGSTSEDQFLEFNIHADYQGADFFTGSSPTITCKLRLYHKSNAVPSHMMYIDMIGLGDMETVYEAPDNVGITTIQQTVQHTTYGLEAIKDGQLSVVDIVGAIATGTTQNQLATTGAEQRIFRGDVKTLTVTVGTDWDFTGKKVYFSAKKDPVTQGDAAAIINRVSSVVGSRSAQITLTQSETAVADLYTAEWEQRDSDESNPLTIQQFKLRISQDVRRG